MQGKRRLLFLLVSYFIEMFVGAARVRDLFNQAKVKSPSIIFIDAIDSIRSKKTYINNDEREEYFNQLLTE